MLTRYVGSESVRERSDPLRDQRHARHPDLPEGRRSIAQLRDSRARAARASTSRSPAAELRFARPRGGCTCRRSSRTRPADAAHSDAAEMQQMLAQAGIVSADRVCRRRLLSAPRRHPDRHRPDARSRLMTAGRVLGVDPGSGKAGYALLDAGRDGWSRGSSRLSRPARASGRRSSRSSDRRVLAVGRGTNAGRGDQVARSRSACRSTWSTNTRRPASHGPLLCRASAARAGAGSSRWACSSRPARRRLCRDSDRAALILTKRAEAGPPTETPVRTYPIVVPARRCRA